MNTFLLGSKLCPDIDPFQLTTDRYEVVFWEWCNMTPGKTHCPLQAWDERRFHVGGGKSIGWEFRGRRLNTELDVQLQWNRNRSPASELFPDLVKTTRACKDQ